MLNKRLSAAHAINDKLHAAENAIDAAIVAASELNALLPAARLSANLSAIVGQPALNAVAASLTSLSHARGEIVDAHNALAQARDAIGLATHMAGGGHIKPLPPSANEKLTLVSDAA